MRKDKAINHMEDYFCVGVFVMSMIMQKVDFENTQIMHCILCYQEPIIRINLKTQARKGLISYYKTNGITSF
jgi:hypothetical protein